MASAAQDRCGPTAGARQALDSTRCARAFSAGRVGRSCSRARSGGADAAALAVLPQGQCCWRREYLCFVLHHNSLTIFIQEQKGHTELSLLLKYKPRVL